MHNITNFFRTFISILIAILRLLFLQMILLFAGLHQIIFTRSEVCNVEMKILPLRCDREEMEDKLAYVDKLMINNPDLVEDDIMDDGFDYNDEDEE